MKTLTVQIPLTEDEATLLCGKFMTKELEGIAIRASLHAFGEIIKEIKSTIPYVEEERIEE